jgi:hypothetical protein
MVPFDDCSSRAVSRELNCECNIADTDVLTIDIFLSFPLLSPHLSGPRSAGLPMKRRVNALRARL